MRSVIKWARCARALKARFCSLRVVHPGRFQAKKGGKAREDAVQEAGQASVEAAIFLPTFLLLLALLLQPACYLYTRCVMQEAAGEGARAALTSSSEDLDQVEAYVKRRLAAVPNVAVFHAGGADAWDIEVTQEVGEVTVRIAGTAQPLPLYAPLLALAGMVKNGEVVLEVEVTQELRPSWLEGSYSDWVAMWEAT
jgi:hypothetical protein